MARRPIARRFLSLLLIALASATASASGRTSVLADLEVNESVSGDVVVFGADLELGAMARVEGDAVVVGGNVVIAQGAVVSRHVVSIFGETRVPPEATVGGRVMALSSVASLLPSPSARRPSLEAGISMRLLTAGGWLLVTTGIAFLFPTRMRYAAWAVPVLGLRIPTLGIMAGLTVMAALIAALGLGPGLGVPMVAALMGVFFVAKSIGLTVLGCWAGMSVLRRWIHHPLPISLEAFAGVLIFVTCRFLPAVGETLWTLISMVALGASIAVIGVTPDLLRPEAQKADR